MFENMTIDFKIETGRQYFMRIVGKKLEFYE